MQLANVKLAYVLVPLIITVFIPIATGQKESNDCEENAPSFSQVPQSLEDTLQNLILLSGDGELRFTNGEVVASDDSYAEMYRTHLIMSPDNTRVLQVFTDLEEFDVVITDIPNHTQRQFNFDEEIVDAFWLNGQTALIWLTRIQETVFRYHVINADDGVLSDFNVTIPDSATPSVIAIHPSLEIVAYRQITSSGSGLTILDIDINTTDRLSIADPRIVSWSASGDFLVVVSANGANARLTVFSSQGSQISQAILSAFPTSFNVIWSPNEEFIAYEAGDFGEGGEFISWYIVVDLETGSTESICISGELYWHPDSEHIAIVPETLPGVLPESMIVYDVNTHDYYNVALPQGTVRVIGWSNLTDD